VTNTSNLMPWILIVTAVVASLWYKGYIKIPATKGTGTIASSAFNEAPKSVETYSSHELGVIFAQAKMKEAQLDLAHTIAKQAGDVITTTFQAPFVPPAPAGQGPIQAGASPSR
jgi:hypothetical protein